jgi:ribosome-associated toxin RatA of RatAB toxin-antitoxin module
MAHVLRSILVPYSRERMFALVHDVERYPEFLPWCSASRVRPGPASDCVDAGIDLSYLGVRSQFVTRNSYEPPGRIRIALLEGPFRSLEGEWTFLPLAEDACKVVLDLRYDFSSGMLGRAVAPVFDRIAGSLIDAFSRRAEQLYGPGA